MRDMMRLMIGQILMNKKIDDIGFDKEGAQLFLQKAKLYKTKQ